jgi:hypothetical protein
MLTPVASTETRGSDLSIKMTVRNKEPLMRNTVFWDMMPHSLVEIFRHFGGRYCLHLHG